MKRRASACSATRCCESTPVARCWCRSWSPPVTGIEENPAAVEDARAGAALSQLPNARFIAADAAAALSAMAEAGDRPAVIVVDPPRAGCPPALLDACARLRPRTLLYVSCSPTTLARDLALLAARGFHPLPVTPYAMLPHTPHIESLPQPSPP